MLITEAPGRSRSCGTAAWTNVNGTVTLKWNADSISSAVLSRNARHMSPPPAQFTTVSRPPNSSTVRSISPASELSSVTSAGNAMARPPDAVMSAATSSNCFSVRETSATAAPTSTNARAIPSPIPRPPPVMSATLSVNENGLDVAMVSSTLPRRPHALPAASARYKPPRTAANAGMIDADIDSRGNSSGNTGVATSSTVGPISSATVCRKSRSNPYTSAALVEVISADLVLGHIGEQQPQHERVLGNEPSVWG